VNRGRALPLSALVLLTALVLLLFAGLTAIVVAAGSGVAVLATGTAAAVILVGAWLLFGVARRLEIHRAYLRATVESLTDALLTTDSRGHIESVNTGAEIIFGYRRPQMVGMRVSNLFASTYQDEAEESLAAFLRINRMMPLGTLHEVVGLRADGHSFPMEFSAATTELGDRAVFILTMRDVTERVQSRAALKRAHDELERRVRDRTRALEEANARLHAEILERKRTEKEREELIAELTQALEDIKTLSGLLPICAACKKIRDDKGYWNQIEVYIRQHSDAEFSHGICPDCMTHLYPDVAKARAKKELGEG
jgi:PAS domain S-box-containing protein